MLKRKVTAPKNASRDSHRIEKPAKAKTPTVRRRFVISSKALKPEVLKPESIKPKLTPPSAAAPVKLVKSSNGHVVGASTPSTPSTGTSTVDLTETIKTLVHLGQEHGYITYDDINDVLPDNLSPDDLDALLSKLRSLDVEIVMDQAEAERAERKQPEQPEEAADEDSRLEILDDPVRMYMSQMGKVPLLTREQEVEICKKIEEAEIAMKSMHLCPRFHGQGTYCHCGKAAVRAAQGAF